MNKKKIALLMAILAILALMNACKIQQGNSVNPTEEASVETNSPADPTQTQPADGENTEATVAPEATVSPEAEIGAGESSSTIPPENVQMGTVEGEENSGLEGDNTSNNDSPAGTTPPSQDTDGDVLGADFDITELTYESFNAMTGAQQKAVIDMFASPEEFMRWYKKAEEKYKQEHPDIEIGADGSVDIGGNG